MSPHESVSRAPGLRLFPGSLGARLAILLVGALLVTFALLGWVNVRLHRRHLEESIFQSARRVSDLIERSTSYSMLRNDREGLHQILSTVAGEPGVVRVRIFDHEGRITLSSAPDEIGRSMNLSAEPCAVCHAGGQPSAQLEGPARFRIDRLPGGGRALGVVNPIENQPACSDAACHAHPADRRVLGVLDASLSLAAADASIAESTREFVTYTLAAVLAISFVCVAFVARVVGRPVAILKRGTQRLMKGDLGHQIEVRSRDEVGDLAESFNLMSRQLKEAREESEEWARTLEQRVEQKSGELQRAYDHLLQVEKMASIGKLAATVAHEINNPLAGILTYARLLRKWTAAGGWDDARKAEVQSSLDLIESESRRCGDIVRNLLMFARSVPMNPDWTDLNAVAGRCVQLVRHRADLASIQIDMDLEASLPRVHCDGAQVEQVLLALVINALEAMPRGGNLVLRSRLLPGGVLARVDVQDDGVGIPPDVLAHLFEPFFTTKEGSHGVGLGLAVSRGIVERHGGRIDVSSDPGRGTIFSVILPVAGRAPAAAPEGSGAAAA